MTFEIAEAYHEVDHHGAACKSRSPILSTEEAVVYLHSVVHEFDYTHPFKAALNAFCLRGELVLEVAAPNHEDIAVPLVISPHVNDLWCDSCAYGTVNDPDSDGWSIPEVVANCRTCPQDSDPSPITCSENSRPQLSEQAPDPESPLPRPLAHLFAAATDADEQDKAILDSIEDELTVYSFGYNQRYIERRCLKLRREELQRWRQLLRDQWKDHDGGHFDVHGIVPPPVLGKSTISVILQLSEVSEQFALVLTQFIPSHGQPEAPFVEAFPRRATRSIIFSICGKHANAENTAVIKQGFKLWLAGEVQWIGHGVFIRILVDDHPGLGFEDSFCDSTAGGPHRMTHVLAEFLPTDHPGLGNLCPVLFDVRWFRPSGLHREYRAAVYKPSPSTRPELLDDLFPRCFPDGDLLCSIWTRGLPCVEGHVAALHRGDFVQLRLMPTWTEAIPRGGVSSAEEFYNYGIQATHWGETGQIPLHFISVHEPHHSTSVRSFHVNTLMEICLFADSIWGHTSLITFVREASDLRRGWYFLVSDTLTDGVPVLINRQVRMEDGDIARQLTAVIVHSGITLRELIRSNFDETWSHDSELRETFINLTPISPGLFDQVFQPTPGTLLTIFH